MIQHFTVWVREFGDKSSKLSQPDCKVLYFLPSDKGIHRQASVLGAPLEASQNLYLDLQNMYDSYPINM